MTLQQTIYGILGMVLFIPIMYYALQALENFVKYEELSMRVVFKEDEGITAFKLLAAVFLLFSLTLIISGYGSLAHVSFMVEVAVVDGGEPASIGIITNLERVGGLIAAIGTLYFMRTVARLSDV